MATTPGPSLHRRGVLLALIYNRTQVIRFIQLLFLPVSEQTVQAQQRHPTNSLPL
jgi:hypothetical protein